MGRHASTSEIDNSLKIKSRLEEIFEDLSDVKDENISKKSANYQVALRNLLKEQCKMDGVNFKEYDDLESKLRNMYENDKTMTQDEKWKIIRDEKKDPGYQEFLDVKRKINKLAVEVLGDNRDLSNNRDEFIKLIGYHRDNMEFEKNHEVLFRSVKNADVDRDFKYGMHNQVLALEIYQSPYNLPFVNDTAVTSNKEVGGHTGGVVAATPSANIAIDFSSARNSNGFDLYVIKPKELCNVGQYVHKGSGYSGKGESNVEAYEEFVATHVDPDRVMAARHVSADGSIGPIRFNEKSLDAFRSMPVDKELLKYVTFDHVDDFKIAEYFENKERYGKIYGDKGIRDVEEKIDRMAEEDPKRLSKIEKLVDDFGDKDYMRKKFDRSLSDSLEDQKLKHQHMVDRKLERAYSSLDAPDSKKFQSVVNAFRVFGVSKQHDDDRDVVTSVKPPIGTVSGLFAPEGSRKR